MNDSAESDDFMLLTTSLISSNTVASSSSPFVSFTTTNNITKLSSLFTDEGTTFLFQHLKNVSTTTSPDDNFTFKKCNASAGNETNLTYAHLPEAISIALSLSAISISILSLVCNSLLIVAILRSRALQTPTNLFLSSLAAGEFLIGVCTLPMAAASARIARWPSTQTMCSLSAIFQSMGRTSSTLSLMVVCLDRCLAVSRPLRYSHILTFKLASFILSGIWLLAAVMALLPINCTWGCYRYEHAHFMCILIGVSGSPKQNLIKEIICSFVPAAVILTSLLQIVREVRSHHRIFSVVPLPVPTASSSAAGGASQEGRAPTIGDAVLGMTGAYGGGVPGFVVPLGPRGYNRNTIRAMRSLFVVTFGYAMFCLPVAFVNAVYNTATKAMTDESLLADWKARKEKEQSGQINDCVEDSGDFADHDIWYERRFYITRFVWLSFLCCVLNPLIIIALNRKFRTEVKTLFSMAKLVNKFRPSKDMFTISTGLHSILEATLVLNIVKKEHASTIALTRRQIFGQMYAHG